MSFNAFRFQMKANATKGLFDGSFGQLLRLNPQVIKVDLNRSEPFTWSEDNAGDLVLTGLWHEISAAIGSANGLSLQSRLKGRSGDVNKEMDDLYGALPGDDEEWVKSMDQLPFYISGKMGIKWKETAALGEVVADPATDVVKLVAGRATGVLGPIAPTPGGTGGFVTTALNAAKDLTGIAGPSVVSKVKQTWEEKKQEQFNGTEITVIIGTRPASRKHVISTKQTTLDNKSLLKGAVDVMALLWKGVKNR